MTRPDDFERATRVALGVVTCSLALLIGGCTSGSDDPAVVTLPEYNTTTVAPPSTLAPGDESAPRGPTEPPELAWSIQMGGTGDDSLNAVTGVGGDVLATGSSTAEAVTPTSGGTDVMTARVGADGDLAKLTMFGTPTDDVATSLAIVSRTGAGTDATESRHRVPLACGSTLGALGTQSAGQMDAWCGPAEFSPTEADPAGLLPSQMGGAENDRITGIAQASDSDQPAAGILYMSGVTDGFYPGAEDPAGRGLGAGDALAFRSSLDGGVSWIRQFGTSAADAALGVCAVGSNGVYVGWTEGSLSGPSKGGRDAWISFIDDRGIQRWIHQAGSPASDQFVAVDHSGDAARGDQQFIAVGSTNGDFDGGGPGTNSGGYDAMAAAFARDGSPIWSTQFGSGEDDAASGVAVDGSTVYVTGTTTATPDEGLGELDPSIGPGGSRDVFLAALDVVTGEPLWVVRLGSDKDDVATGITATENGLLVISGNTNGKVSGTEPAGGTDGFLLAFPLPSAGGAAASSV